MLQLRRRPAVQAVVAAMVVAAALSGPAPEARPLFRPRPGPMDHPLAIAAADFDRDGKGDLAVVEYQAAVVDILVGRGDGTFAPLPQGPVGVGTTTFFSKATLGPFEIIVTDLNPNDADSDRIPNASDNCPNVPNGPDLGTDSQKDANTNGVGDACEKLVAKDPDGKVDDPVDTDGDGVFDYNPDPNSTRRLDNCPNMVNPGQEDTETAAGTDTVCGTKDDNPLLNGPDGKCGTADDRIGDGVGDACEVSMDLLVLNTTAVEGSPFGAVRVRVNDGSGGMLNRAALPTGFAPSSIAVADVTLDGIPDLLIANAGNDLVQLFFGAGEGEFTGGIVLTTGKGPQAVSAVDIDKDDDVDPIVLNGADATLNLFRNAPATIPASPTETFPTAPRPTALLSGDLNGDTYQDIVVLGQGDLLCAGGPRDKLACSADSECRSLADPNDPTKSGTCTGGTFGTVQVFAGGPAGPPPGLVTGPVLDLGPGHRPRAGALRDLDGDTRLDLVIADFTGGAVLVLKGNGDGTFATPPTVVQVGGGPADLAFLPGSSDLVVLNATDNRVDLLQWSGTTYAPAPTSPASPWRDTASMALIGADSVVGFDAVLLQPQGAVPKPGARIDVLSGIGDGSYRSTPSFAPKGAPGAPAPPVGTSFAVADLRQDGRPDLAILDATNGTVTIMTGELSGQFQERDTVATAPNVTQLLAATPLAESVADYDRDGVPNVLDDCPTVYNPPKCTVKDPKCAATIPCTNVTLTPTACDFANDPTVLDPVTQQCDSDRNGIGDQCQVMGIGDQCPATPDVCCALDSDFDLKADYDQNKLKRTSTGELDFDGDGIANLVDKCPTVADPLQTDTDGNGVGDACQTVGPTGENVDTDKDGRPDYDTITHAVDDCPLIYNPGQEDNDNDHVGNACVVASALDNCIITLNPSRPDPGGIQADRDGDGVGDACAAPAQDLFLIDSEAPGGIKLLLGDNSGTFRPDDAPTLPAVSGPTAVSSGHFGLTCTPGFPADCDQRTVFDLAVTEEGTFGASGDDFVAVFQGTAVPGNKPVNITFSALPAFPLTSDPTQLLRAPDQQVCPLSGSPTPLLRFDPDNRSDYLLVLTPAESTLNVLIPSNQNVINPSLSPLVRPVAFGAPLPLPAGPVQFIVGDVNQDLKQDIVVMSSTGPATTIRSYFGLGNGLFFTDPTLDTSLPFASKFLGSANIDLRNDSTYPDLLLFETRDQAPFSLLNTLPERADIDASGRVDGYDLALLARAFGSTRGEDFTLLPDDTFARTGVGPLETIVHTGTPVPGQDLPSGSFACNTRFDPGSGLYGVPVDINLDGIVDGLDLAFLASRYGTALP
ncbi:MAG TPA: thrombospondin type 3 repeat-containing protein [Verrucomicrobiae bacterium]|nr:thrombospondin type 3 repeat-containing protein [Verrucomicrobiae bacterium]